MRFLYAVAVVCAAAPAADWTMYIAMATSKNYVVGAKLPPSGIFRRDANSGWQQAGYNHPFSFALDYDRRDPGTVYLAAGNGLIRMRQQGSRWKILTGSDVTELRDVSVGSDNAIWFAHTAGVRVSLDGGETWTEVGQRLHRKYTEAVRVDRTKPATVLIGGEEGIFRTEDAGKTWRLAGASGFQIMNIEQSPHDPCFWLAATQLGGLFASRDCGRSFENAPRLGVDRVLYNISFDPADSKRVAVAGWGFGVAVSEDECSTWNIRNAGLPSSDVWSVAFDPARPGRLWASVHEEAMYRSDDAGRTWIRDALEGSVVYRMLFVPGAGR
jgi:photosystem II stability/assembly factor-like uncharacterized protein